MRNIQLLALAGFVGCSVASAAVVTVGNSGAGWLGYMNVSNLPEDGGGFQFGSPWGIPDLVAVFNDPSSALTLSVNTIGDPNPYWYIGGGGPGAQGNKIMEANLYHETTDVYNGQTVIFKGTVNSNSFSPSHTVYIFIKDFASDYSSYNVTQIPAPVGPFSISLDTDGTAGRHVQWGFQVVGPCVWFTDAAGFGNAEISTAFCAADFDGNGFVNGDDFDSYVSAFELGDISADFDSNGFVNGDDFDSYVVAFEAGC